MVVAFDEDATARAHRLEDAVAELKATVANREVRPVGREELTVDPDVVGRHGTSTPSIADNGPRAFATVSSHSASGSLRQVIPPPAWRLSSRPSATKVRIRMLVPIAPSGPIQPSAPVYGPRRTGSS